MSSCLIRSADGKIGTPLSIIIKHAYADIIAQHTKHYNGPDSIIAEIIIIAWQLVKFDGGNAVFLTIDYWMLVS